MALSNYTRMFDAMVFLMDPLIEVVIHDLAKNNITYINGKLSDRKVGDSSLLDQRDLNNLDHIAYPKINFDGRLVKSISLKLEEKYLLCLNCDVSIFSKMQELSSALLQKNMNDQPPSLFTNDWQEKLHASIYSYLQNYSLSFNKLKQQEKKELAKYLFELGAFKEKNAVDYVAKILKLGRATVFKYLKEWRNQ